MAVQNNIVTTTLVISFTDPETAGNFYLSAEIDGRKDGYNKGNTSFLIGTDAAYLVYASSGLVYTQQATSGSIGGLGSNVLVEQVESISFTKTTSASLSKPPAGGVTWIHVGGDTGALTVSGNTVTTPNPILAVYQATYYAAADAYRLSGVGRVAGVEQVSSLIYIEGQN